MEGLSEKGCFCIPQVFDHIQEPFQHEPIFEVVLYQF
jgi:hypothetical protein